MQTRGSASGAPAYSQSTRPSRKASSRQPEVPPASEAAKKQSEHPGQAARKPAPSLGVREGDSGAASAAAAAASHRPVMLVLGDGLHCFPWESLPILREQRYCWCQIGCKHAHKSVCAQLSVRLSSLLQDMGLPPQAQGINGVKLLAGTNHMSACLSCSVFRMPSLACAIAVAARRESEAAGELAVASCLVDVANTFYTLNPSGDLVSTQRSFETWFAGIRGWEVSRRRASVCVVASCFSGFHLPLRHLVVEFWQPDKAMLHPED